MKTLNIYAAILFSIFSLGTFAQTNLKKDKIKVWGNCGTCKGKIEKAAKTAGATTAVWSEKTKILKVSYDPSSTGSEKIQKAIAAVGYDTQDFKGDDEAYNKLMDCCKYERNKAFPRVQL